MSRMVPNTFSVGLSSESYVFRASRLRLAPQFVKRIIYAARRLWGKLEGSPRPMQNKLPMHPQPAVWSADKERQPLPVSGDAERPLPDARRDVPGSPEG